MARCRIDLAPYNINKRNKVRVTQGIIGGGHNHNVYNSERSRYAIRRINYRGGGQNDSDDILLDPKELASIHNRQMTTKKNEEEEREEGSSMIVTDPSLVREIENVTLRGRMQEPNEFVRHRLRDTQPFVDVVRSCYTEPYIRKNRNRHIWNTVYATRQSRRLVEKTTTNKEEEEI